MTQKYTDRTHIVKDNEIFKKTLDTSHIQRPTSSQPSREDLHNIYTPGAMKEDTTTSAPLLSDTDLGNDFGKIPTLTEAINEDGSIQHVDNNSLIIDPNDPAAYEF